VLDAIKNQEDFLSEDQYWWDEDESTSLLPSTILALLCHLWDFRIHYDKWSVEPGDSFHIFLVLWKAIYTISNNTACSCSFLYWLPSHIKGL